MNWNSSSGQDRWRRSDRAHLGAFTRTGLDRSRARRSAHLMPVPLTLSEWRSIQNLLTELQGGDMDADWLLQLATSGATTLVGAAATTAWEEARSGFARLFGRGEKKREEIAAVRLDALAAEVEQAESSERDAVRQRLLPVWQTRLADLLEEDPAVTGVLRSLRDELLVRLPKAQQQWVQNITADAVGAIAQGVMFGNIYNYGDGIPGAGRHGSAPGHLEHGASE